MSEDFFINEQQERFCREYVQMDKPNGTQAAISAGYSDKPECAAVQASRLLKDVKVRARINALRREALESSGYDREEVRKLIMRRMAGIVAATLTDIVHVSPDENDPARADVIEALADVEGGQRRIDFGGLLIAPTTALSEDAAAALKSIKMKSVGDKDNFMLAPEIELHDPVAASRLLAEISGLKQADVQVNISVSDELDEARRRANGDA